MASEVVLSQIAIILPLIGMSFGWKGVMTKYAGFYDTQTAWNQVFWGLLLGAMYGLLSNSYILEPALAGTYNGIEGQFNVFNVVIIVLLVSLSTHFMLIRKKVRHHNSQPTSGWALGLSLGAMVAMFFVARMFLEAGLTLATFVNAVLFCTIAPRAEALITCFHGHLMLQGRRWGAVIRSMSWRMIFIVLLVSAVDFYYTWIFILPFLLIFQSNANTWIWESIPKESRRRLRRIWAQQSRETSQEINILSHEEE
ncbi:MAG: hypothetical protein O3A74_06255 [archaeon]|nr:hypothetical protein [archaeon]MDA0842594.1 hypothetical protein [archaeon]